MPRSPAANPIKNSRPEKASFSRPYLVGWWYETSAQKGVRAQRLDADGIKQGGVIDIASGSYNWRAPVLGYAQTSKRFLAVYTAKDSVTGETTLWGQAYTPSGNPEGSAFQIRYVGSGGSILNYDLAYNLSRNEFLVVWDEYNPAIFDVYGQRVKMSGGAGIAGSAFPISDDTDGKVDRGGLVAAVPTAPGQGQYLVAWSHSVLPMEIIGRFVAGNGSSLGSFMTLSLKPKEWFETYPDVAGSDNGWFQVAWSSFELFYYGGFILGRSVDLAGDLNPEPAWQGGTYSWAPAIAAGLGNSYLVVYMDTPIGNLDQTSELWGRLVGARHVYLSGVMK